jgi:heat shock protein HtpX
MYDQIDSNKRRTVLLISLFLIFIIGVGWIFSRIYNNPAILVIAVVFSTVQVLISYYYSDKITLFASGAIEAPRREPFLELHRLVENLAITAGLPKPKIYVVTDSAPNAFATGRDPNHAVIAVTTGLLDKLNKKELEGVIAHELSHVGNYDIRLMTVVVVLVGAITLVSDWFMRSLWFRGRNDREGGNVFMIVGIVLAILTPIAASLVQLAISRRREYLADASGALLTRYPEGLADALEVISKDKQPLRAANRATAHLYIANPFKGKNVSNLFSTHPPIEDRIKKLQAMDI